VVLRQKTGTDELGRNLILEGSSNAYLNGILSDDASTDPYASVNIFGKPLVIYNVEKLQSAYGKIRQLSLPVGMSGVANQIAKSFPEIQIDEYTDPLSKSTDENALNISMNSVVIKSGEGEYAVCPIVYPWDILTITEYILDSELKTKRISKDVSIESCSVIEGPCLIESGVSIDNFCKIKGPVYIGKDCKIGTGSLIRNSMLGPGCVIGFSCEVARSYIAGQDTFPHYDAVLDSVVGEHTWMGGYVAITNVMLNNKEVKYKLDGNLVQTGLFHFGAVIGHHSTIGAAVVILPGRFMPPRSFIPPHVLYSSSEERSLATPASG
jgi:NDP-sugar pyrophosphorylase family protein